MSGPWEDYKSTSARAEEGPWADYKEETPLKLPSLDPNFKKIWSGFGRNLSGVAQAGAEMLAGMPSYIAGGLAGASTAIAKGDVNTGMDVMNRIQESNFGFGKFKPWTKEGELASEMVQKAARYPVEKAGDVGEYVGGNEGRFAAELVTESAMNFMPLVPGAKAIKGTIEKATAKSTSPIVADIRAAQEAKRQPTRPVTPTPTPEVIPKTSAEAVAQAFRERELQQQSAFWREPQHGNLVAEDPMARMVRDLGGEPVVPEVPRDTGPLARMADDLTAERSTPEQRAAQDAIEARQRELEAGVSQQTGFDQNAAVRAMDGTEQHTRLAEQAAADKAAGESLAGEQMLAKNEQGELFAPQTNMFRDYTDLLVDDGKGGGRLLTREEFDGVIKKLQEEPGTTFPKEVDPERAYADYVEKASERLPPTEAPAASGGLLDNFKKGAISSKGKLGKQRGALDPMFMKDGYRGLLKAVSRLTDSLGMDKAWQEGLRKTLGGDYLKNEDGTPMVLLHGTTGDIVGPLRSSDQGIHLGTPGSAHFFTQHPNKYGSKAVFSAKDTRLNGQIYPTVIKEGNYPKLEVDVGDWSPKEILTGQSPAKKAVKDAVSAALYEKGFTPSTIDGLFRYVDNARGISETNRAWMDVLNRAGIDGFFYRNTAESPKTSKIFDLTQNKQFERRENVGNSFEHPMSFVTWDDSKVKSVYDYKPSPLKGPGKSQAGAINLWQTPDPNSIVGKLSRIFKDEGVDLLDQGLIPPTPDVQSILDLAKQEGPKGDGKFISVLQSGSTSTAMKTRSPLILAGSRIGQNALKLTDLHVRNYVIPAETAMRRLSKTEIADLWDIMLDESKSKTRYDTDILANKLSGNQLAAYDKIRKMQDNQLEAVNQTRKDMGLDPIDAHEAYLASRWQGDFRRPVYQLVRNADGEIVRDRDGVAQKKLVWYLAADTKIGLNRDSKALGKYAEAQGIRDLVIDDKMDHTVSSGRRKTDLESAYTKMIDFLGRNDPAVKAMGQMVEEARIAEGYNAFGEKKHFEEKAGIRGFTGDRPWKNREAESIRAFEQQFLQTKNAYSWAFTQKAVEGLTQLTGDAQIREMQPNNVKYLQNYAKQLLGMNEAALAKALDDSFRSMGVSPARINAAVGGAKSFFILQKLAGSLGNITVNVLQTTSIPSYLAVMAGRGYKGNPLTALSAGLFAGPLMASAHYVPGRVRDLVMPDSIRDSSGSFIGEAVKYAEANGVTARSVVDESPVGQSKSLLGQAQKAASTTLTVPETIARSVSFMSYAEFLRSSGKFSRAEWPEMFRLAEEYTNMSMVDYRQSEQAMVYAKGGTVGSALNVLQTYPVSVWNQYGLALREGLKGSPLPLVMMLGTHYLLAGLSGVPGLDSLDKLYKLVKDNIVSTEMWNDMNKSSFWKDPKVWALEQIGSAGVYGKLSDATGVNWSSRTSMPGVESMVSAPGGAALNLGEQAVALGKAVLDPTNSTKWAQSGMLSVPTGLQGLLEQADIMKDHTWVTNPKTGEKVYLKNTDLAAREGRYVRTPEEEAIRAKGLRSQKEVLTRDLMYSISNNDKVGKKRAGELPDKIYDAIRRGDQEKAKTLVELYVDIGKDPNAASTLQQSLERAAQNEFTTTEQKAAIGIKDSINRAVNFARARKILEEVK
jgi:hypothetical protein